MLKTLVVSALPGFSCLLSRLVRCCAAPQRLMRTTISEGVGVVQERQRGWRLETARERALFHNCNYNSVAQCEN